MAGFAKMPIRLQNLKEKCSINKFGDDACFTLNSRRRDYIGIADGVGGWRSRGYDPSAFSSSLMTIAKDIGIGCLAKKFNCKGMNTIVAR